MALVAPVGRCSLGSFRFRLWMHCISRGWAPGTRRGKSFQPTSSCLLKRKQLNTTTAQQPLGKILRYLLFTNKMSRPVEQALNNLIPRHPGALPPELIELARSLLAQSRSIAGTLKAEEEIGRTYACANIACER